MNGSSHRSVGLDNLRNSVHIMNEKYNMDCRLQISYRSENGGDNNGTIAKLSFKILD